ATQVLRLSGNVTATTGFTFLGVPDARLALHPSAFRARRLPPGRAFAPPASTHGDDVAVRAWFRSPLGDFQSVTLGHTHGARQVLLHGRIPFARATLSSLELDVINSGRLTANAGTGLQPTARGQLRLGTPSVDGTPVRGAFTGWIGRGGVTGRLAYSLTPDHISSFRPRQPSDGRELPVLATPAATAALALALALVGLVLGVAGDRRDERGELFDLEAQGAPPATLRLHLRLRALLVAAFGLAGGIATGAILSRLVLSLVSVTASAAKPEPPLQLVLDLPLLAAAVAAYAVLAVV